MSLGNSDFMIISEVTVNRPNSHSHNWEAYFWELKWATLTTIKIDLENLDNRLVNGSYIVTQWLDNWGD